MRALDVPLPPGTPGIDRWATELAVEHRSDALTDVFDVITAIGGGRLLLPIALALGVVLWRLTGDRRPLALLALAYAGSAVITHTLKAAVGRDRPPVAIAVDEYGWFAFPSGHATQSAAVCLTAAALLAVALRGRRSAVLVWTVAVALTLAIGISRVYLAAHWLTDVLAGWTFGAIWAWVVVRKVGTHPRWTRSESTTSSST